jgi:hypothetical protein
MRCAFLAFLMVAMQMSNAGETAAKPQPKPTRTFACYRASKLLKIDGKLNEEDWKNAPVLDLSPVPPRKPETPRPSKARILWDNEFLYLAAEFDDADIFSEETRHDRDTPNGDLFEFFVKPSQRNPYYFEFHVSPRNVTTDLRFSGPGVKVDSQTLGWDSHLDSRTRVTGTLNQRADTDKGWTVEVRIPWDDFSRASGTPAAGDKWAFAICRYDYTLDQPLIFYATAAFTAPNFHDLRQWDLMEFRSEPPPKK